MNDLKQNVEELGVLFEKFGRTPMESRVFAYLLLAEPPHKSFDEIREFLGASKSAISNAINFYLREGSVTYKTFSGDRKRYFMVNTKNWQNMLIDSAKNLTAFNVLLEQVLYHRKDSTNVDFNNDIKNILDFQIYLSNGIEQLILDWQSK